MVVWPVKKYRVDAKFLDPGYPVWRKNAGLSPDEHPGIDINVQGTSGDGDLGYPVVAMAEGRVVHVRSHRVWGLIVLIEHPTLAKYLGLDYLASQYAHLLHASVSEGEWVSVGEAIGSIGKGDPMRPFLAHLHFEIRKEKLPADFWPGRNRELIQKSYMDPESFLQKNPLGRRGIRDKAVILSKEGNSVLQGRVIFNYDNSDVLYVRLS